MKLQGIDYLNISPLFSDDDIMVQHTTREFVEKDVMPIIEDHYRRGSFPSHLIPQLVEMGFLGRDMFVLPNLIRFQSV